MKIIALYTLFSGEELIEGSIKQIYDHVDEIVICWQNISNNGHANPNLKTFLNTLKSTKISLRQYVPNLKVNAKENELLKYNLMLECAKLLGGTHFIVLAADHYYNHFEFKLFKKVAGILNLDVTVSKMFTYYKYPTWQITPVEDYYCPFICKLYPETVADKRPYKDYLVDPSARISTRYEVGELPIMLHHYSMVRKDVVEKFKNAASPAWSECQQYIDEYNNYSLQENPGLKYFQGRKIKVVPNYFEI